MASTRTTGSNLRQIITVMVLLLLFLTLGVSYFLMTRPPEVQGDSERDRQFLFSIYGFEGDLLRRPSGACFDAEGNIYVADTGKKRIVVFDPQGNFRTVFGEAGKEPLKLWNPLDVAVTPDGRAFVVDKTQNKIVEFDQTGVAVREIETPEAPTSITIQGESMFVTTESGVLIADLDGDLQTGYISFGKEPGQFDRPAGVAVAEDGTLFIADSLNYRVQALSTSGEPLWQYGQPIPPGEAIQYSGDDRKFGLPASIAIDANELLYVVDGLNHQVIVLDRDGEFIETIGDMGHADGTFYYPDGIDYADGRIVVADKFNDRVSVFETPLPPSQRWRAYVPYAALLLLLPLFLLPFLRRGQRYVVTPQFVTLIEADQDRDLIATALKQVHAEESLAAIGSDIEGLDLDWKSHQPDDDAVASLIERFGLEQPHAQALAVASSLRGRRVLMAESAALRDAARQLEVPFVTYAEVKAAIEDSSKRGGGKGTTTTVVTSDAPVSDTAADDMTTTEEASE